MKEFVYNHRKKIYWIFGLVFFEALLLWLADGLFVLFNAASIAVILFAYRKYIKLAIKFVIFGFIIFMLAFFIIGDILQKYGIIG